MKSLIAYDIGSLPLGTGKNIGQTYSSAGILVSVILRNSITIAGIIFLALLIFGGITFIINSGNGDSKKAQQGKSAITNALIGFAIVLFAYSIITIIEVITGLNILKSNL